MRICLLTSQDLDAEVFPADDWPCDPRPFYDAEWHTEDLTGQDARARIRELAKQGFDLYFNLCDGAADEDRPGIEVVHTLEELGVPFTGATSECYEPTRVEMKEACAREGIAAPAYVMAETEADVDRAAAELTFPLFVKHYSSYASVSLSRASKVASPAGLRRQATKIMKRHERTLIEEYVDGPEFTVLVAENPFDTSAPTTYQPVRYEFPDGESFKHSDMKWVSFDDMKTVPVTDAALDAKLRDVSARFFRAIGAASFGRVDIRVDQKGTPFVLEINPNCGVYYPDYAYGGADLCLANDPAGHVGFTQQIMAAAFARHARRVAPSVEGVADRGLRPQSVGDLGQDPKSLGL